MASDYGRKGGSSATAGRKAATFEATAPDGSTLRKRGFFVDPAAPAFVLAYQHAGQWYAACAADAEGAASMPHYQALPARVVKP